jgi:hypothetical protein
MKLTDFKSMGKRTLYNLCFYYAFHTLLPPVAYAFTTRTERFYYQFRSGRGAVNGHLGGNNRACAR